MFKKLTIMLVVLCCFVSLSLSQEMMLGTRGITTRGAEADTTDIFDRAYNGLTNVGVETQMYLVGKLDGASLTAPTWTVTGPVGSQAAIGATFDADTSTQIAVFTPDVVGTYTVEFTDGNYTASLTINAGTYRGNKDGLCGACHSDMFAKWEGTGHSTTNSEEFEGMGSDHYALHCVACHSTGYDENAANDGFDDFEFVFPDTFYAGKTAELEALYPDAMKRSDVQCEACHGPGSAHMGNISDSKMVSTINSATCAYCHDGGTHHIFPLQWDVSRHGNPLYAARGSSASCAPCHSGSGFVAWVKGGKAPLSEAPPVTAITCATCHDPHSASNGHQVRLAEAVELGNGEMIEQGGMGLLCMNCHKGRRNAAEYTGPDFSYSSHFGPHHGPQADVLAGKNFPTFGKMIPSSPHLVGVENACVTCHMAESHELDPEKIAGAHSFRMVSQDGTPHVEACEACHGNIGETFAEKKFYFNGTADHDGDGVEEGLQEEVHGLLEELAMMLPPIDTAEVDMSGDYIYTVTEVKAAYNWFAVEEDRSLGIHNPAFVVGLLKTSMQAVHNHALEGDIVAIEDVPNDQGKQVRIIWDKMADDGVAIDPIERYIVKRMDGENDWTGVGLYPAHGAPRYALVVPTLFDSTGMGPGMTTFKVVAVSRSGMVHESMPGEGYSVDNLVPHAPGNFMAMLAAGNVDLTWEAPADPDINYYKIYRGTDAGFTPDESNMVGTTIDLAYTDTPTELGTYYYVAAAVDFSGNRGDFTSPVSATLTSVDDNGTIPLEYELAQNYPNPFNPQTSIKFSLKQAGRVRLNIFNSTGQIVRTLVDQDMAAGSHNISFVADGLTSGVYIYRIMVTNNEGSQFQAVKKMILMK